jgi:hypothetical protein
LRTPTDERPATGASRASEPPSDTEQCGIPLSGGATFGLLFIIVAAFILAAILIDYLMVGVKKASRSVRPAAQGDVHLHEMQQNQ